MSSANCTADEIARRGEQLYDESLREKLEPGHRGRFLVLDIDTGDYEIADDDLTATQRLLTRCPQAVTYGVRIGRRDAYHLGAAGWNDRM